MFNIKTTHSEVLTDIITTAPDSLAASKTDYLYKTLSHVCKRGAEGYTLSKVASDHDCLMNEDLLRLDFKKEL